MTFDSNIAVSNGGYACTETDKWSMQKAIEARRRDDQLNLCHRHRHMHYPFQLPGMVTKKSPTYYDQFVDMGLSDSEEDPAIAIAGRGRQARIERNGRTPFNPSMRRKEKQAQAQEEHLKETSTTPQALTQTRCLDGVDTTPEEVTKDASPEKKIPRIEEES